MVKTARDHYSDHLGPVYTWMLGDIDAALSRSAAELDALPHLGLTVLRDAASGGMIRITARKPGSPTAAGFSERLLRGHFTSWHY